MQLSHGHGGNIRQLALAANTTPEALLDFSANLNPLGPPPWLRLEIAKHVSDLIHYPDPDATVLKAALTETYGLDINTVVTGNGSTELLFALFRLMPGKRVLIPSPAYVDYANAARAGGCEVTTFPLDPDQNFCLDMTALAPALKETDIFIAGHPNNPTGKSLNTSALEALIQAHPDVLFVIDESFADFLPAEQQLVGKTYPTMIVMRSLTKFFGIPGLRVGFMQAPETLADQLNAALPPWSVNTFAIHVGAAAVRDTTYAAKTRDSVSEWRTDFIEGLHHLPGVQVFEGEANFLLLKLMPPNTSNSVADALLKEHKIAVRVCDNYDHLKGEYLRIAVRTADENRRLLHALATVTKTPSQVRKRLKKPSTKPPALMIQGTSSNAGKSVLAAAFCRILLQDGFHPAPFKAQNMSLNSHVTANGGEMGRAQVVQAQACRREPDVRMNPVLLKPNSDTGSQVIIQGKPVGNMNVSTYINFKSQIRETVHTAYDDLSQEADCVVLEGAGSPAEVNLKKHDIVNMAMAKYAQSPVLLTGDIDRGGVYAAFVGTMEVMEEWERQLVGGFLVNRFRGDASLLGSANAYVENFTGKPVYGVIPYVKDISIPEEDSVSFKETMTPVTPATGTSSVKIGVIDLPHVSNFTDIAPFEQEPDVILNKVRHPEGLTGLDAIILPGSKSTIHDLRVLQQEAMAAAILDYASRSRGEVVGLCGGFQMLGTTISDPGCLETDATCSSQNGLGLLDMVTELAPNKTLQLTRATHQESGLEVRGYEIHHGISSSNQTYPLFKEAMHAGLGATSCRSHVWGTYLHGVFDDDRFRRWFIDRLRVRKGMDALLTVQTCYDVDTALDNLAETVRAAVDMEQIYNIMGLK